MGRDRIHGPYKHRNKWRLYEVAGDGTRSVVSFETRDEALAYKETVERAEIGRRVGEAVRDYVEYLRQQPAKGGLMRRGSTLKLVEWRLRGLLRLPDQDMPLACLTRSEMRRLLDLRATEVKTDTLIGELNAVRRWAHHWLEEGDLSLDPTAGLVVTGERSAGKPQLRMDEARRFLAAALADDTPAGVAAALALLTGCRASEVTGLVVHDLDDGGRVLWVADNLVRRLKTRKQRQLEVPTLLQERLRVLATGRAAEEQLFGAVDRHWLAYHVDRLCQVAGVPRVTPHGLRGTWASLARGVMPTEQVAATIGNHPQVSATAYIRPGAAESEASARVTDLVKSSPTPASPDGDLLN